jgi:hypothetical protein
LIDSKPYDWKLDQGLLEEFRDEKLIKNYKDIKDKAFEVLGVTRSGTKFGR